MFASHVLVRVTFEVLRSVFSQNYADTPMESAFCSQSQTKSHFYHQVKRQEFWKTGAHVATKSFWKRGMASLWHQYHRLGSQKCVIHKPPLLEFRSRKKGNMYVLTDWVGGPNWIIFISRSWRTDQVRHDLEIDHPLISHICFILRSIHH